MNKILAVILVMILNLQIVSAQIAINSFSSNPESVLPGKEVSVSITVENVGDDDIEDILVRLDLSQVPFAPVGSASERVIDKLNDNAVTTVTFDLVALPDASSQIYKIPVKLVYENVTKDSLISLNVAGQAKLDVALDSSELVKIGDKGKVVVKFVNTGLADIKFLTVKLAPSDKYELLSTDTVYIGKIDPDDFETAEFTILTKDGNPELTFNVNYRDSNNRDFNQLKIIRLNVYSMEEAKQLGLIKTSYTLLIVIIVVLLVIGFFVYRAIRRRRLR